MTAGTPLRASRRLEAAARLVRLFSMGATIAYPVVGAATSADGPTPVVAAWAVAVAVAFHVFAAIGNDVADLPLDRTDPRRTLGPLVRGTVAPEPALLVAVAAGAAALGLAPLQPEALRPLVAAVVLVGAYNVAGKRVPVPVVADAVQGAAWAALVVAGAAAAGGATAATWWAAAAAVVYTSMVNGVHGAIRDVVNDRTSGARTTAALLGADVVAGQVVVPAPLVAWGVALQAGFGVALAGLIATRRSGGVAAWVWWAGAAGVFAASTVMLVRAYRARRDLRAAMGHGTWHLFLVPVALLAAVAAAMPRWLVLVAAATFLWPPWAYGRAVRGTEFGVPATSAAPPAEEDGRRRARALWRSTRFGNSVAVAASVALGGYLGGEVTGRLVPLMVAAAAVVLAANVFNDRCDFRTDAVNRPDRPLVTGAAAGNDADRLVLAAVVVAVGAAALHGVAATVTAGGLLVVGLAYSVILRRAVLGHLTVAALFATPILYGGWLGAGEVRTEHWLAAALAMLFVFARETLKGVPDRRGDVEAGYRTLATWRGEEGALRVFRAAAVAFCLVAVGGFFATRDVAYLIAALACAVAPTVRTLVMVRGAPTRQVVDEAVAFSGRIVGWGVIPLLFLG